ncbi:glycine zipper 2TM domain-containing protein [Algiphilus sp.]|uniref:glycine zipper 2TM domain-containing protein n=1 Tax=Algiphilus sp. TaxID=1872431 RepID=UPI003B51F4AB
MNRANTALLIVACLAMPAMAMAQVNAPVVDVQPIYRTIQPAASADCRVLPPSSRDARLARVLGGLAGGYAGNQIGSGSGRDLATIAGAIAGSEFAASRTRHTPSRCSADPVAAGAQETRVIEGYDVIYHHAGRLWRTRRSEPPGDTIAVPDRRAEP